MKTNCVGERIFFLWNKSFIYNRSIAATYFDILKSGTFSLKYKYKYKSWILNLESWISSQIVFNESPEEQQETGHQISNDNSVKNSSDTRHYGIKDEEEFQEECIIPDQQNLAYEIQGLCSGDQDDQNIGSSEVLLDIISQKFSSKKELGKPVSEKLSKILIKLFLNDMEEEKFKTIKKKVS